MQTFVISEQGLARLRLRTSRLGLFVCLLVLGVVIFVGLSTLRSNYTEIDLSDPYGWISLACGGIALLVSVPAVSGFGWFSWKRQIEQNQAIWKSIQVELGADYIARRQLRIPEIRIGRNEITRVEEVRSGLCVRTANKYRSLAVPDTLEDYEQVKATLSAWAPIIQTAGRRRTADIASGIAALLGMGIIFFSLDLWLVVGAGTILTAYFVYSFWALGRYEGVDKRYRRNILFLIVWLLFITAMKAGLIVFLSRVTQGGVV